MPIRIPALIVVGFCVAGCLGAAAAAEPAQPQISGMYDAGALVPLTVRDRSAYLITPTGTVDPGKRWVWIAPYWLGISRDGGEVEHRMYVERLLAAGFHVAGVNVGTSCGSPTGAEVFQEFYELLLERYGLNPKVRLIGQSNGGLIAYAWAFRHPQSVDKIAGIYPATDFRTWPMLPQVITYPDPGLGYNLTLDELTGRIAEFNPIDNLEPLAKAGVRILHIHGDKDELVPMEPNSTELARRYEELGGTAEIVVIAGLAHGGKVFYESEPFIGFLLAD
ncbi:MAG: alpha/beta fold hydrolase [Planctomycetaceae bacterium]|nr:alpha/beta fold hydrolase [Planctomycetaceae bacterium]